jgi:transcription elongation GreA/GreB family factor
MKQKILSEVVAALEKDLALARQANAAAIDAATADENRPENQYDTRALEASYLARAQGLRTEELARSVQLVKEMPEKNFKGLPIAAGALIELSSDEGSIWYIVLPGGAGLQVKDGAKKVQVLTPDSPLGRLVCGKKEGDVFEHKRPMGAKEYEITSVQ